MRGNYNPELCERLHNDNDKDHAQFKKDIKCIKEIVNEKAEKADLDDKTDKETFDSEITNMKGWVKNVESKGEKNEKRQYAFIAAGALTLLSSVTTLLVVLLKGV